MSKISWQIEFDYQEPYADSERDQIRALRWELDVDHDSHYSLQELLEMKNEQQH